MIKHTMAFHGQRHRLYDTHILHNTQSAKNNSNNSTHLYAHSHIKWTLHIGFQKIIRELLSKSFNASFKKRDCILTIAYSNISGLKQSAQAWMDVKAEMMPMKTGNE